MKIIIIAAMLAVLASCTKITPEPQAQSFKKHPGYYQVIIQGGDQWNRFTTGEGWTQSEYDLFNIGNRVAASLQFAPAYGVIFGIEAQVNSGTLTIEFSNTTGVLQTIVLNQGHHVNTWNPTAYYFTSPATSITLYFEGTGGYLNAINLIKIQ